MSRDQAYSQVFEPLVNLLESSHTSVSRFGSASNKTEGRSGNMEVVEPALGRCAGVWMTTGRPTLFPTVIQVRHSIAAPHSSIRVGWKLLTLAVDPASASYAVATFLDEGATHKSVRFFVGSSADVSRLKERANFKAALAALWNKGDLRKPVLLPWIGIVVGSGDRGGAITIADVDPNSLGARADLYPGLELKTLSAKVVDNRLKSEIEFVSDRGEEHRIAVDKYCPPSSKQGKVIVTKLDSGSTLIRFDSFSPEQVVTFRDALKKDPFGRVIIDLRHNSGGSMDSLRKSLSFILPHHTYIGKLTSKNGTTEMFTPFSKYIFRGSFAILVGSMTASSAEVFTDVLQAYKIATAFGSRTAGAAELSYRFRLPDNGQLQVAEQNYLSVDGHRIERLGVVPSIRAEQSAKALTSGADTVVTTADKWLGNLKGEGHDPLM